MEKTAGELKKTITNLASRIKALEAITSTAPPKAPPREEEGRAESHGMNILNQGANPRSSAPGSTLVKGENTFTKLFTSNVDIPESSSRRAY